MRWNSGWVFLCCAGVFAVVTFCVQAQGGEENIQRPNVVLIVGDDIGFSDIGCFGSEVNTPNLDRLGMGGMRFTQFYNMSKCNPTRSSLMTGLYLPRQNAQNAQAFPRLLSQAGYYTAMCGKEHFDKWVPERCFAAQSFDDSFVYWTINSFFVPPAGRFEHPFTLNGNKLQVSDLVVNKQPLYKTDVVTDYALGFLDKAKDQNKPFFLYLPYHTAHYPLQARAEDIAKYRGRYRQGWDAIRKARFDRQKELGVIPADCTLSPPEDNINEFRGPFRGTVYTYRPWDALSEQEQDDLDLEMAVFAAMIDCMDQNIGRVIQKLDEMNVLDNTLIMYLSDNGSCPYDSNRNLEIPPGGPDSYRSLCAAWANVGNTPFRFYKQYGHEGGCRTHFIAHWPQVISPGRCESPAHVVDLYPTLLALAGAQYPAFVDKEPAPDLDGQSLLPLFKGGVRPDPEIMISGSGEKFRMVRSGDWKIVKVNGGLWQLYNLREDPTELRDLANLMPEKIQNIEMLYDRWRENRRVVLN